MIYNEKYSKWYYGISQEHTENLVIEKYKKRSDRILSCLNLWHWDKYELNKVLDLQSVNRCNNTRFCPNCKLLDISKFIYEFRGVYEEYIKLGYSAYMMTLTIPSVSGEKLCNTITNLNKAFRKLIEKYSYSSLDKRSYGDRLFKLEGGIKVLEITYNEKNGFHPHFHCVVFTNYAIDSHLLKPLIIGKYSTKRKQVDKKSLIEQQLSQVWSMIWYKERLTKKNIDSIVYDLSQEYFKENKKVLEVDFRELDERGIYEVFKYTFKDTHIKNYYVFKTLVNALDGKRIRQGFGILYNMQCEDVEVGEVQELELDIKENPSSLLTREIKELITTYKEYRKVSRFNRQIDNNIKD